MKTDLSNWNEGDLYKWTFKEDKAANKPISSTSYLGVVVNSQLRDTFWGITNSYNHTYTKDDVLECMDVVYLGNINDYYEVCTNGRVVCSLYNDEDVFIIPYVGLPHAYYVKKQAVDNNKYLHKSLKRSSLFLLRLAEDAERDYKRSLKDIQDFEKAEYRPVTPVGKE